MEKRLVVFVRRGENVRGLRVGSLEEFISLSLHPLEEAVCMQTCMVQIGPLTMWCTWTHIARRKAGSVTWYPAARWLRLMQPQAA